MIQRAYENHDETRGTTLPGAGRTEDFICGSLNIGYVNEMSHVSKHSLYNEYNSGVKKKKNVAQYRSMA